MVQASTELAALNAADRDAFVGALGGIFENASWVAERAMRQAAVRHRRRSARRPDGGGDGRRRSPADGLHPRPSGARRQGRPRRRHDGGVAPGAGQPRARPPERGGVRALRAAECATIAPASACPSSSACAATPAIRSWTLSRGGWPTASRPSAPRRWRRSATSRACASSKPWRGQASPQRRGGSPPTCWTPYRAGPPRVSGSCSRSSAAAPRPC